MDSRKEVTLILVRDLSQMTTHSFISKVIIVKEVANIYPNIDF